MVSFASGFIPCSMVSWLGRFYLLDLRDIQGMICKVDKKYVPLVGSKEWLLVMVFAVHFGFYPELE